MPSCPLNDSAVVGPWPHATSGNGQLECGATVSKRSLVQACRNIPQFAGVGVGLDEMPVHLVSNPNTLGLRQVALSSPSASAGLDILAHVGSLALVPGAALAAHGLQPSRYAAHLELATATGCTPNAGFELRLGDLSSPDDALNISISRHYCQELSLPLTELDLQ